jgi:hypothetical protein
MITNLFYLHQILYLIKQHMKYYIFREPIRLTSLVIVQEKSKLKLSPFFRYIYILVRNGTTSIFPKGRYTVAKY